MCALQVLLFCFEKKGKLKTSFKVSETKFVFVKVEFCIIKQSCQFQLLCSIFISCCMIRNLISLYSGMYSLVSN